MARTRARQGLGEEAALRPACVPGGSERPWVHLETESQHYRAVPNGSELFVEAEIVELFEKKGHEFVDLDVAAFLPGDAPVLGARLRAIYKLRGA